MLTGADKITSSALLADRWVFEWDPDEHKDAHNPGYGSCVGKVVKPHGDTITTEWCDGETDIILRTNVRLAIPPKGRWKEYIVDKYTASGVILKKRTGRAFTESSCKKGMEEPSFKKITTEKSGRSFKNITTEE